YYGILGPKGLNPTTGLPYEQLPGVSTAFGGIATQGILGLNTQIPLRDITDGASNTFLIGELSWHRPLTGSRFRSWVRGSHDGASVGGSRNIESGINTPSIALFNDIAFGSMHPGGCHFTMADGSTRFVAETIGLAQYKAAGSYNGKEVRTLD